MDLTATTAGGTSATSLSDRFTYSASTDVPTVWLAPSAIPATPGPVTYTVSVTGDAATPTGSRRHLRRPGWDLHDQPTDLGYRFLRVDRERRLQPLPVTAHYSGDVTYGSATATLYVSTSTSSSGGTASSGSNRIVGHRNGRHGGRH